MNDIERQKILNTVRRTHAECETETMVEAGAMLGHRIGIAERAGIPHDVAVTSAIEHIRLLGECLLKVAAAAPELVHLADLKKPRAP